MKYLNNLNKISSLMLLSTFAFSSCINFQEINTNQHGVTTEMGKRDGIALGAQITALEKNVVPVGTQADGTSIINSYQIAYHIGPDTWAGYFAQNAGWIGGFNHTTYNLVNGWVKETYKCSYTNAFTPWLKVKTSPVTLTDKSGFALAQILKVSTWHKAADAFGPIPYTKAGTGLFVTPYDAQDVVYKEMLKELSESIDILTPLAVQGVKLFPDFDAVYAGDAAKWVKYANSLMLRLAMRVRFADADLAKNYAEKAVNHSIGVMKEKTDMAQISTGIGLSFVNNIETLAGQYAETRMSVDMFSYLVGYEDPRIVVYFKPSEHPKALELNFSSDKFLPFPPGFGSAYKPEGSDISLVKASLPNITSATPTYWMRASEVYFLRAEGALIGWSMGGNAEDLYKDGIKMSVDENGINPSDASAYIASNKKPVDVDMSAVIPVGRSFHAKTTSTVKFEGTDEEKLEKIITQKWISLYPNGMEAWTEWRRTGYPHLQTPISNRSGGVVNTEKGIRRMHYTIVQGRSKEEQAEYEKAVTMLQGPDTPATNLWWDKKN